MSVLDLLFPKIYVMRRPDHHESRGDQRAWLSVVREGHVVVEQGDDGMWTVVSGRNFSGRFVQLTKRPTLVSCLYHVKKIWPWAGPVLSYFNRSPP